MTTGDRAVSALYVNGRTRHWSMELDRLPNQGQLDTSVPAHVVDLDAIQRAAARPPRVVRHRPRLPLRRRRRSLWGIAADLAALALALLAVADSVALASRLLGGL